MNPALDEVVREALAAVASKPAPMDDSGWRIPLLNGAPHFVKANIEGGWLLFDAECPGGAPGPDSCWGALEWNASLDGLAKFVRAADGGLRLRGEIPVIEGVDLTTRVRETCGGFEAGWSRMAGHSAPADPPAGEVEPIDIKRLCSEAGWPFAERGGRRLAVELEIPGGFCQASLVPTKHGVRVSCEVVTLDTVSAECRQAVGGFLLAAGGLVRMGRASVNTTGMTSTAQFEVVFGTAPSPFEISSALESLSVGYSLCGEEVKTLQTPAIAERYLALRGRGATSAVRRNERTVTP